MHIIMAVLGWVLLGLLGLLAVLLVLPVYVDLQYKDQAASAVLRVLFWFKIPLYPRQETPEPEQGTEKSETPPSEEKKKEKSVAKLTLEKIWRLVSTAGVAMRLVLRAVWITHICVVWPVHEDDAAQTAIAYGQAQAYFGGAVAALRNFLNLRKFDRVDIVADYDDKFASSTHLACTIGATPVIMGIVGVYALVRVRQDLA